MLSPVSQKDTSTSYTYYKYRIFYIILLKVYYLKKYFIGRIINTIRV